MVIYILVYNPSNKTIDSYYTHSKSCKIQRRLKLISRISLQSILRVFFKKSN